VLKVMRREHDFRHMTAPANVGKSGRRTQQ
jgi:hypothetical protein